MIGENGRVRAIIVACNSAIQANPISFFSAIGSKFDTNPEGRFKGGEGTLALKVAPSRLHDASGTFPKTLRPGGPRPLNKKTLEEANKLFSLIEKTESSKRPEVMSLAEHLRDRGTHDLLRATSSQSVIPKATIDEVMDHFAEFETRLDRSRQTVRTIHVVRAFRERLGSLRLAVNCLKPRMFAGHTTPSFDSFALSGVIELCSQLLKECGNLLVSRSQTDCESARSCSGTILNEFLADAVTTTPKSSRPEKVLAGSNVENSIKDVPSSASRMQKASDKTNYETLVGVSSTLCNTQIFGLHSSRDGTRNSRTDPSIAEITLPPLRTSKNHAGRSNNPTYSAASDGSHILRQVSLKGAKNVLQAIGATVNTRSVVPQSSGNETNGGKLQAVSLTSREVRASIAPRPLPRTKPSTETPKPMPRMKPSTETPKPMPRTQPSTETLKPMPRTKPSTETPKPKAPRPMPRTRCFPKNGLSEQTQVKMSGKTASPEAIPQLQGGTLLNKSSAKEISPSHSNGPAYDDIPENSRILQQIFPQSTEKLNAEKVLTLTTTTIDVAASLRNRPQNLAELSGADKPNGNSHSAATLSKSQTAEGKNLTDAQLNEILMNTQVSVFVHGKCVYSCNLVNLYVFLWQFMPDEERKPECFLTNIKRWAISNYGEDATVTLLPLQETPFEKAPVPVQRWLNYAGKFLVEKYDEHFKHFKGDAEASLSVVVDWVANRFPDVQDLREVVRHCIFRVKDLQQKQGINCKVSQPLRQPILCS